MRCIDEVMRDVYIAVAGAVAMAYGAVSWVVALGYDIIIEVTWDAYRVVVRGVALESDV